ncbi:MAG: glycosyl hydrolase [Fibrobacteria bacterium]
MLLFPIFTVNGRYFKAIAIATLSISMSPLLTARPCFADMVSDFAKPPLKYRPKALRDGGNPLSLLTTGGFGGFGELATCQTYRSPAFYTKTLGFLDSIAKMGGSYTYYDEEQFPSGSAGYGRSNHGGLCNPLPQGEDVASRYPENTIKRLDKTDHQVTGPTTFTAAIPTATTTALMAVVAMSSQGGSTKLVDLTDSVKGNSIAWNVPTGQWNVMVFQSVKSGDPQCDYMDSVSVDKFIQMSYQQAYDKMKDHFGKAIQYAWYDEPSLQMGTGREWTPLFNKKFKERMGFSPTLYYPALWYNIGPDTQAARNLLFGFRSTLFSEGFVRLVNLWGEAHGIRPTGHLDNEDWTNPVGSVGDVIKAFKYSTIPGLDDIGYAYTHLFYKFFSSAAYNWDKTLVGIENGGNYGTAIEQLADGVQMQHTFQSPAAAYNEWHGRCGVLLHPPARHVADIAILYPIASCQGSFFFDGPNGPHANEKVPLAYADYPDVGEILSSQINRDFTWIHPEVLDEKCSLEGSTLKLNNTLNHEEYKVVIIPACSTISWSNLKKIRQFFDQGGKVIATGVLPSRSAELGKDDSVVQTIRAMFLMTDQTTRSPAGGIAVSLGKATSDNMLTALNSMAPVYDVEFEPQTGGLRYIHKVLGDSLNIYFFGNNSAASITTFARLRGDLTLKQWDPHTGQITSPQSSKVNEAGTDITRVSLTVASMRSVLLTSPYTGPSAIRPAGRSGGLPPNAKLSAVQAGKNLLLTYSIPKSGREEMSVKLEVFGVNGERVALLVDRKLKAGTYAYRWESRRVPGGHYIARLEVEGMSGVRTKVVKE